MARLIPHNGKRNNRSQVSEGIPSTSFSSSGVFRIAATKAATRRFAGNVKANVSEKGACTMRVAEWTNVMSP